MSTIPFHPVADIFPLMSGAPFDELVEDIKVHGLREMIWLHEGQIVDGRNRYLACLKAGVEPKFRDWDGTGTLVGFVVSLNLHRRHLSESQRAMVAARLVKRQRGWNQHDAEKEGVQIYTPSLGATEASSLLNVSRPEVYLAKRVRSEGAPEVVSAVEHGDASVHMATRVLHLPQEHQPAALAHELSQKGKKNRAVFDPSGNGRSTTITPKTRTYSGRKAPEAVRSAIGMLVGVTTGFGNFTVKDAAPTADEAGQWDRDLAGVVTSINRFRRQLKEHINGQA